MTQFAYWDPDIASKPNRNRVQARKLDPNTREPIVVDGAFVTDDPIRQEVLIRLTTTAGSIPGLENIGASLQTITHVDQQFESTIRAQVRTALEPMIEQEKVRLRAVLIEENNSIRVEYVNLRKRENQTVFI